MTLWPPRRRFSAIVQIALLVTAAFAGCNVGDALVGGSCSEGYTQCGDECVVVATDPDHCGACGNACRAGSACTDGVCESETDGGGPTDARSESDEVLVSTGDADTGEVTDEDTSVDGPGPVETDAGEESPSDVGAGGPVGGDAGADTGGDTGEDADHGDEGATGEAGPDAAPGEAGSTGGGAPDASDDGAGDAPGDVAPPDASGDVDSSPDSSPDAISSDASDDGAGEASADAADDAAEAQAPDAAEAGDPCAPLTTCGGQCTDTTTDPLNCGACSVVCASQLCSGSRCVGAASGGIVYLGHDYASTLPNTAQARLLSNAVFVSQSNPLHVLSYERYASAGAVSHVDTILSGVARQLGRTLVVQSSTDDSDVPNHLVLPDFDVLLVHDQPSAPDGALAALGASFGPTLANFTLGGGVVIVLDGGTGIGQMPDFATASGLLSVTAHAPVAIATPLVVASHLDFVGIGVVSPYGAGANTVSLTTEGNGGNVIYVVTLDPDAGAAPIVIHKAF